MPGGAPGENEKGTEIQTNAISLQNHVPAMRPVQPCLFTLLYLRNRMGIGDHMRLVITKQTAAHHR